MQVAINQVCEVDDIAKRLQGSGIPTEVEPEETESKTNKESNLKKNCDGEETRTVQTAPTADSTVASLEEVSQDRDLMM